MAKMSHLAVALCAVALVRQASSDTCTEEQYLVCQDEFSQGTINWLCGDEGAGANHKWCEIMAEEFNALNPKTQVKVTKVPFADFQTVMTEDLDSGINFYNLYFHAMGLYVGSVADKWADLTDMVRRQQDGLEWENVGGFFQKHGAVWDRKVKIMPLDGDFHSLFYRLDLFERYNKIVPTTLEEFVELGEFFNGLDLNDDGDPDFGICIPHNNYASPYFFIGLLAPWLQYKGSSQGMFFDTETMEPLFDNPAGHEVMKLWKRTWFLPDPMDGWFYTGGPGSLSHAFQAGRCAMSIGWDELFHHQRGNWVDGKVGVSRAPGSTRVWDRESKELKTCTRELCPHAVEVGGQLVNYAVYNAFNGFSMAINSASSLAQTNTAFKMMAHAMTQENRQKLVVDGLTMPDNSTAYFSAVSPNMYVADKFEQAGFPAQSAKTYVANGLLSITSENVALELRFSGNTMGFYGGMMDILYDYYREEGDYQGMGEESATAKAAALVQKMWADKVNEDPVAFQVTYKKMLGIYDGASACELGERYVEATGECEVCPAGEFGSYDRLSCQACGPGRFTARAGMSLCSECAPGSYQDSSGAEACANCSAGTFASQAARSECTNCSAGRYASDEGARECTACGVGEYQGELGQSLCASCPSGQITSQETMVQGQLQWVPLTGATDASACGCGEGTRPGEGDACVGCGDQDLTGLVCRGKDDVVVAEGFYAERGADAASLSIFKCHGAWKRCVGGEPGETCASGREGTSCGLCKEGYTEGENGTCVPCDPNGSDRLTFIVFSVAGCVLLFVTYVVIDRSRSSRPRHTELLVAMVLSITVTLVQQLGVVSLFEDVNWADPIRGILWMMQLLMFNIEVLQMNCVVSMSPVQIFSVQVSAVAIAVAFMLIAHTLITLVAYKAAFRSRTPALFASIGTIFLAFYISVVTTVLGPFQCLSNPNGLSTVRGFPSVVCWDSGEHQTMIIMAVLAVQVPLCFYTYCFVTVWRYPRKMREGNAAFLQVNNWLFFRYKPEVFWFAIVHMTRSLLLAVVPVIPNGPAQIMCMVFVMIIQLMLLVGLKPWRLPYVNSLDIFFAASTVMVLVCASFYVDAPPFDSLAWLISMLVVLCLLAFPIITVWTVLFVYCIGRKKKKFDYFLCHHKGGAGAFTRLLKLVLKHDGTTIMAKREVFVDADNLTSLDNLFDFVANMTDTLVIIASKHLLSRPWCMGEITTARAHNVNAVKLVLPDFHDPTDEFIDKYADIGGDISTLTNNGIVLSAAQDAMRWFRDMGQIGVPAEHNDDVLKELSSCIAKGTCKAICMQNNTEVASKVSESQGKVKIIADMQSWEACASAMVLVRMLGPHFAHKPSYLPQVLHSYEGLPASATHVLLVCSAGALEKEHVLMNLMKAGDMKVPVIPILVAEGFQFPSKLFVEEHRGLVARPSSPGVSAKTPDAGLEHIRRIFATIGIGFPANGASEQALQIKAHEIAGRLELMVEEVSPVAEEQQSPRI